MKNIVLIGFMGTGKTRAGKVIATRLDRQRFCMDEMIEWKVGKPISKIFEEDGEAYFRKIESEVVKAVSKDRDVVIDAGGGVVIDENNVKRLKEHGILFCLTATPEIILERTKNQAHRPLLNTEDPVAKIGDLMAKRREHYKCADYEIDTSDISPDEVADKIIDLAQKESQSKR